MHVKSGPLNQLTSLVHKLAMPYWKCALSLSCMLNPNMHYNPLRVIWVRLHWFVIWLPVQKNASYSERPNTGLVRYSNGHFVFGSGMVTLQPFENQTNLSGFARLDRFIQNIFFFYVLNSNGLNKMANIPKLETICPVFK